MTAPSPRRLADVPGLVRLGELLDFCADLFGGTLAYQLGPVLFVLPDAARCPAEVSEAVELRNVALVLGECPGCGRLRPALAAPAGVAVVHFPSDPHRGDCPASDASLARTLGQHPSEGSSTA